MLTTKNKIPLLQITNLTKLYGIKKGINNLSVELYPGDICGFLGVNGSGKTTTLTCIAGVQKFDKGEILIKNISIKKKTNQF
jgi:ABC-2 type transport system ATP-binding protein